MRSRKAIIIVASLLAVVSAACIFDIYSFTQYSCLECRATLTKRRICGMPFQHVTQNAFSTSVLAHDSSHQHRWRWWGSEQRYSLFSASYACGRQHPIWRLPVSVQSRHAQLVPASELHDTLRAIDSPDRTTAQAAVSQVYERVLDGR